MDTKERTGRTLPAQRRKPGQTAQNRRPNKSQYQRREEREAESHLQDVVYTPPKPFVRNRFLLRLASIGAIVLALVLAMSVFFRVEHVQVSGAVQYTPEAIKEASGIQDGEGLLSLNIPGIAAKIKALPYVKDVRIGIKLPNIVMIEITEVRVTYAIEAESNEWWLVDSSGCVVGRTTEGELDSHTKVIGVQLADPKAGEQCVARETATPTVDENGNPIPTTVTAAHRLSVALSIADSLEANGVIGQATSIDVSDLGNIQFWYGQQFHVKLGDENSLAEKISAAKGAIDQQDTHDSGVLELILVKGKFAFRYTGSQ